MLEQAVPFVPPQSAVGCPAVGSEDGEDALYGRWLPRRLALHKSGQGEGERLRVDEENSIVTDWPA
jgi:hypothetical protein